MQIDWWTFVAQIVNLIILLFLLRKFLYMPLLKIVDARQKMISGELKKASDEHKKAEEFCKESRRKIAEAEAQKQQILVQAREEADKLAQKLAAEANTQFAAAQIEQQKRLLAEQKRFALSIQDLLAEQFVLLAEGALKQIANSSLNEQIVAAFMRKIQTMPASEKQTLIASLADKKYVDIQVSSPISAPLLRQLEQFLRNELKLDTVESFDVSVHQELICGVAVQADEQLVSWNLSGYMQEFEQKLREQMQQLLKGS